MKEHPILMNGPMVVATLDGRKTQTRRLVKPQPVISGTGHDHGHWSLNTNDPKIEPGGKCGTTFGVPKELEGTWEYVGRRSDGRHYPLCEPIKSPYQVGDRLWVRETWKELPNGRVGYRASIDETCEENGLLHISNWRPSIHMPRWASRLTLEVTAVRCEQISEISEEDAKAEGMSLSMFAYNSPRRSGFAVTWNNLYPGSWERNNWVWVYTFKVIPNG